LSLSAVGLATLLCVSTVPKEVRISCLVVLSVQSSTATRHNVKTSVSTRGRGTKLVDLVGQPSQDRCCLPGQTRVRCGLAHGERPQRRHSRGTSLPFLPAVFNEQLLHTAVFRCAPTPTQLRSRRCYTLQDLLTLPLPVDSRGEGNASLLPPDGFSPNQLRRLIENFGWILHVCVHDGYATQNRARLAFTEHSTLP
jgi:hypothetical protein